MIHRGHARSRQGILLANAHRTGGTFVFPGGTTLYVVRYFEIYCDEEGVMQYEAVIEVVA